MAEHAHVGDLEIDQDLTFQRRSWVVQRVGWTLMLLLLASATAGLLGPGPLSASEAGARDSSLWVEYNRFERYQSPTRLRLHLGPGAGADGLVRVALNREFVEGVQVVRIVPDPASVETGQGGIVVTLRVVDSAQPADAVIEFEPNTYGVLPIRVGVVGGPEVAMNPLVYP